MRGAAPVWRAELAQAGAQTQARGLATAAVRASSPFGLTHTATGAVGGAGRASGWLGEAACGSAIPAGRRAFATGNAGGTSLTREEEEENWYSVLGLPRSASTEEIKEVYRALAKVHHPDANHTEMDEARFTRINDAYAILGNEKKKAEYDASHARRVAEIKAMNEGHAEQGYAKEHFDQWQKDMEEGMNYVRDSRNIRGQYKRATRAKVEVPSGKQTMWKLVLPFSIILLYAFNHFVFKATNPDTKEHIDYSPHTRAIR